MTTTIHSTRTRTITWEDPLPSVRRGITMSGLESFRGEALYEPDEVATAPSRA